MEVWGTCFRSLISFLYLSLMFIITVLFPRAFIIGFELFDEDFDLEFNELNVYLGVIGVSYRWRSDGEPIDNLDL
jgi:hypothetical protein